MANPAPGFRHQPNRIAVASYPRTVTVRVGDTVIASSDEALELRESGYPPVLYIPFRDISFEHLERTATRTHCPFKGDASYWRIAIEGEAGQDVMWAYESPYEEVVAIRNHGAFYPDRVRIDAG